MTLKTLKDIESDPIVDGYDFQIKQIPYDKLKAEAIKWIKILNSEIVQFNKSASFGDVVIKVNYEQIMIRQYKIEFIKHFFNISEEDLQ